MEHVDLGQRDRSVNGRMRVVVQQASLCHFSDLRIKSINQLYSIGGMMMLACILLRNNPLDLLV